MADALTQWEVPISDLRVTIDPQTLPFDTTEQLEPLTEIIGQERALEAFRYGLGVNKSGYHIFVTGASGTGRLTTTMKILEQMASPEKIPCDLCYVYNFQDKEAPKLIQLPAGTGRQFKKDIQTFVETLQKDVPHLFESEDYVNMKTQVLEEYENRGKQFFKELGNKLKEEGFAIMQVQMGTVTRPVVMPLVNDQPTPIEKLEELVDRGDYPREKFETIRTKQRQFTEQVDRIFLEMRDMQREVQKKLEEMDRYIFLKSVEAPLANLKEKYQQPKAIAYLDAMAEDMADNLDSFRSQQAQPEPAAQPFMLMGKSNPFHPYQVNLLVDNGDTQSQPIVVENYPNHKNLFGSMERIVDRSGVWTTDFSRIHAGSLLKANGGFLVLNLMDTIIEPGVWPNLKRALKCNRLEFHTVDPFYLFTTSGLTPEPVDLDLKVVVVGDARTYYLLNAYDEDTKKIFKIRADFSSSMKRNQETADKVARYIRLKCDEEALLPFDRTGVAAVVEEAIRRAGRKEKITAHLYQLNEVLVEADFHARGAGAAAVSGAHVEQAIQSRMHRVNLMEEQIQEMIDRGTLLIATDGAVVGQVNGLAVYSMGDHAFGKPSRITAVTSMGRAGVVNIEREADLSGQTHNKGVLILSGYLRGRYAQDKPLTMTASLAFEQSYSGVDGDSASSTEIYSILSSLSGLPIRQDIAVTGSVNQKGEVQAIGGVNYKIEGFYDCCKARGLTGRQGVMIPASNVQDLMLRKDVVEAVAAGKFHLYAVPNIDQGIEILTGVAAGSVDADGHFPEGTVHHLVHTRLLELAKGLKEFGDDGEQIDHNGNRDKPTGCPGCH